MNRRFEYRQIGDLFDAAPVGVLRAWLELSLLDYLLEANEVGRSGVIHVGGHRGEEVIVYALLGFGRVLLVEPLDEEFEIMTQKCSIVAAYMQSERLLIGEAARPPIEFRCVRCAASDRDGVAPFYRTADPRLSSLARPERTADKRYDAVQIQVETRTLDSIVSLGHGWTAENFSYLRLNIQSAELMALNGAPMVLDSVSAVCLETSLEHRYHGQPSKDDFDRLLGARGFECVFGVRFGEIGNLFYRRSLNSYKNGYSGFLGVRGQ